jgi:hypothetical protein
MLALSAASILWSVTGGIERLRASRLSSIAERTWGGEGYRAGALESLLEDAAARREGRCLSADEGQAVALIAFAEAAQALKASSGAARKTIEAVADHATAAALCAPGRAWPWFLVFWARTQLGGLQPDNLPLLWLSYQLGAHESDLQLSRNAFVARHFFDSLPAVGQDLAISEFGELVQAGYAENAARTFAALSPEARRRMLPAIEQVPAARRQTFINAIRGLGIELEGAAGQDAERQEWERYLGEIGRVRSLLRRGQSP